MGMTTGLAVTDGRRVPLGVATDYELDCAWGRDENDFTLRLSGFDVERGALIMVDGGEIGGIVDTVKTVVSAGVSTLSCSGRTWHGILASKILAPDRGQDWLTVSGEANDILRRLIARTGLTAIMDADTTRSGINVGSYRFDRYVDAYTGIRAMLRSSGAKLRIRAHDGRIMLSAVPVATYGDSVDSDRLDFTATSGNGVNHLVCLGGGELRNRVVVDLYADAHGNISTTPTYTGLDEHAAVYDYSNASKAELEAEGRKKLAELLAVDTVDVTIRDSADAYEIGDVITARDNQRHVSVTAEVAKVIVKIGKGVMSVSYEVGDATDTRTSLSGSAESTPGGHAYYAGDGLTLDGYTFNADVKSSDLSSIRTTAENAAATASGYASQIGAAQQAAANADRNAATRVRTVTSTRPVTATRDGDTVTLGAPATIPAAIRLQTGSLDELNGRNKDNAHYGAYFGAGGNTVTGKPAGVGHFGLLVLRSADGWTTQILSDPATGRLWQRIHDAANWHAWTALADRSTATTGVDGLLSAADKRKLDSIAANANAYTLPTATTGRLGGVKPDGRTITIGADGTISAQATNAAASFLAAHPVGCLYHTTDPTDPGARYGGTWRQHPTLNGFIFERTS